MSLNIPLKNTKNAHINPNEVGDQAVLGRQQWAPTPWLTERHGYDPTYQTTKAQAKC